MFFLIDWSRRANEPEREPKVFFEEKSGRASETERESRKFFRREEWKSE